MTTLTIILRDGKVIVGAYGWAEFKKMWVTGEYSDGRHIAKIQSDNATIEFKQE